jgi:hypothetical protein
MIQNSSRTKQNSPYRQKAPRYKSNIATRSQIDNTDLNSGMVSDSNSRQNKKVSIFHSFLLMCFFLHICYETPVKTGIPSCRLRPHCTTVSSHRSGIIMYYLHLLEMFLWILPCSQIIFSRLRIEK